MDTQYDQLVGRIQTPCSQHYITQITQRDNKNDYTCKINEEINSYQGDSAEQAWWVLQVFTVRHDTKTKTDILNFCFASPAQPDCRLLLSLASYSIMNKQQLL